MEKLDSWVDASGVLTETSVDPLTNKFVIQRKMDLAPYLEHANALRNSDDYTKKGIKKGWWHIATIDPVTIVELKQIGIDIYRASVKEIVAGLKKLNKDGLMATRGRV